MELPIIRMSPLLLIKSKEEKCPLLTSRRSPAKAIVIPRIWSDEIFSLKIMKLSIAMNTGVVPIIQPVFDAVVHCRPVTWIHKWKHATRASTNIQPWSRKLTAKLFFCLTATTVKNTIPKICRIKTITTGLTSVKAFLVAIKENPQTVTAKRGFQIWFDSFFNLNGKMLTRKIRNSND